MTEPVESNSGIEFVNLGANTELSCGIRNERVVWFRLLDVRGYTRGGEFPRMCWAPGQERYRVTFLDEQPELLLFVIDVWLSNEWARWHPLRGFEGPTS